MSTSTPIIGWKDNTPIILCIRRGNQYVFYCQYCQCEHTHGAFDGHRAAHCISETPFRSTGYYVVGSVEAGASLQSSQNTEKGLLPAEQEIHDIINRMMQTNPAAVPSVLLQVHMARLMQKMFYKLADELGKSVKGLEDEIKF